MRRVGTCVKHIVNIKSDSSLIYIKIFIQNVKCMKYSIYLLFLTECLINRYKLDDSCE